MQNRGVKLSLLRVAFTLSSGFVKCHVKVKKLNKIIGLAWRLCTEKEVLNYK